MKKLVSIVGACLLLGSVSFGDSGLQVLDGSPVKVLSLKEVVLNDQLPSHIVLKATVQYPGACYTPSALVVTRGADAFTYNIVAATKRSNLPHCFAIAIVTQEIEVTNFYEVVPNPVLIKVNGVGLAN